MALIRSLGRLKIVHTDCFRLDQHTVSHPCLRVSQFGDLKMVVVTAIASSLAALAVVFLVVICMASRKKGNSFAWRICSCCQTLLPCLRSAKTVDPAERKAKVENAVKIKTYPVTEKKMENELEEV